MPEFSILCPVYNVEKYLADCIESVIKQTFKDYELILVDDGSTDSSGSICDRYASEYPFIKAFHKPNEGLFATRRLALKKAEGDWIVHLDSDDWLEPNTLERIREASKKYDADCVIYGLRRVSEGKVIDSTNSPNDSAVVIDDKRSFSRLVFLNGNLNSLCRKAAKRENLGRMDFSPYFHISKGEDQVQTLEIIQYSNRAVVIPDILYNYRFNPRSITSRKEYHPGIVTYEKEELVLDFLKNNGFFNDEDFEDFRKYMEYWLNMDIMRVMFFHIPFSQKKKWLDEYSDAKFVREFIACKGYHGKLSETEKAACLLIKKSYHHLMFFCLKEKMEMLLGKKII